MDFLNDKTRESILVDIRPTEDEIVSEMNSNYCRCGSYNRIKRAVARAARQMRNSGITR